jgi:hypothetical protein
MGGRHHRAVAAAALVAFVLTACGGGGAAGAGTTTGDAAGATPAEPSPVATSPSPESEASPTPSNELAEASQACIDAFVRFLVDVEDTVAGFDFAGASLEDYSSLSISLIPAVEALAGRAEGNRCAGRNGAPSAELIDPLIELARSEAPGSVAYLELLLAVSELRTSESCTEDIDALQTYVDAGGTIDDLTTAERWLAFDLATAINSWCSLQTAGEYLSRGEVERFLEIA